MSTLNGEYEVTWYAKYQKCPAGIRTILRRSLQNDAEGYNPRVYPMSDTKTRYAEVAKYNKNNPTHVSVAIKRAYSDAAEAQLPKK